MQGCRRYSQREVIDTHEILRKEIYSQTFNNAPVVPAATPTSTPTSTPIQQPAAQLSSAGFEDYDIYFDSVNKISMSGQGVITYNISELNGSQPIENCVEMRIRGPFYFPRIANAASAPDYFYFRRVYMQITSLSSTQSVRSVNNFHHFEFQVDGINSVAVYLTPINETIYFRAPLTSLSEFKVRFYVPMPTSNNSFMEVVPPKDTVIVTGLAGTNPARFTFAALGDTAAHLVAPTPTSYPTVPTAPGIAVYMKEFDSSSATLNNQVTTNAGLFIDNIVDSTTFEISSLNFTTLAGNTQCTMIIPKNRIAFHLRFTSLQHAASNKLVGVKI